MRKIWIFLIGGTLIIGACKKYDEGPYVSLRTKKERVTNEWKVEEATGDDGSDNTSNYDGQIWEFTDDNDYRFRADSSSSSWEGKWNFENDKEELNISGGVFVPHKGEYEILRLKEEELWLERDSDNEEIHLAPK